MLLILKENLHLAGKKIYRVKSEKPAEKVDDGIKRTGRIHVVSKKVTED